MQAWRIDEADFAGAEHLDERYLRAVGYATKSKRGTLPKMALFGDIVGEIDLGVPAVASQLIEKPSRDGWLAWNTGGLLWSFDLAGNVEVVADISDLQIVRDLQRVFQIPQVIDVQQVVEVGVGLIPGGGGNVNTYRRLLENTPDGLVNLEKAAQKTFENVAMAKVSKSAFEARELGYVRTVDQISMNRDHLTFDAKQLVLELDRTGYTAPAHAKIPVVGRAGKATLELATREMFYGGYISEHDLKIAGKLAHVIAGGNVSFGTHVDEQYMLDIERKAFLSLIGELKTQQRMQHMLVKGKPLRN